MARSRAMEAREPGQVRKEAALSGHLQALRERRTGARDGGRAPGTGFDGGCTVHFLFRVGSAPAGTAARRLTSTGFGAPAASEPRCSVDTASAPASFSLANPANVSIAPLDSNPVSTGPSLYRRHRPRTFADVVGQEHVVRTLSQRGRAGQGPPRLPVRRLAGDRQDEHGEDPRRVPELRATGRPSSPCGECDSCVSIASATSLDVIEMDAASNNSVDDIRDLREKVAYAPVSGRHKVYILDEAHMLSPQAWNAFLKTLEEPPPRTIFVLATTEAQKVLPTVVDRCHRFDFGRPTVEQVADVLRPGRRSRSRSRSTTARWR